jgi:hypothetical protein
LARTWQQFFASHTSSCRKNKLATMVAAVKAYLSSQFLVRLNHASCVMVVARHERYAVLGRIAADHCTLAGALCIAVIALAMTVAKETAARVVASDSLAGGA